jgi:hypothetical protein
MNKNVGPCWGNSWQWGRLHGAHMNKNAGPYWGNPDASCCVCIIFSYFTEIRALFLEIHNFRRPTQVVKLVKTFMVMHYPTLNYTFSGIREWCICGIEPNFWIRLRGSWIWRNASKLKPKGLEFERTRVKPTPIELKNKKLV